MNRAWIAALAAGVLAASACASRAPEPRPVPSPEPASTGIVISPPSPVPTVEDITACVVRNGRMGMTPAHFSPVTGDTTVNGRPFREAYPTTAEYAAPAQWYADNEPITIGRRRYIKYGLPRVLGPADVVPVGSYQGVTLFAEPAPPGARVDVYYLPVSADCQFQPYEGGHVGSAVRG